jgi:hypothetical protein
MINILQSILNSNLFASLLGTMAGGIITLLVSKYILNKQFKQSKDERLIAERKILKNSILVLMSEIANNHVIVNTILKTITDNHIQVGNEPINVGMCNYKFENCAWQEYRNILIPFLEEKELLHIVGLIYFQVNCFINTGKSNFKALEEYLKMSNDLTIKLREYIDSL